MVYGILTVMHENSRLQGKNLELRVLDFISRRYFDTINDLDIKILRGGWRLEGSDAFWVTDLSDFRSGAINKYM